MKRFLVVLMLVGLMSEQSTAVVPAQVSKPQRSRAEQRRRVRLNCAPRRLRHGDTLTLTMSVPHGRDLAIFSPDNRIFWIKRWEPDDRKITTEWYAFENVRRLRLPTHTATGYLRRGEDELIFTRRGWYRVALSDNMETDDGTPVYDCRVYYAGERR